MANETWLLGDGGRWKSANTYPTYAIMSLAGEVFVQQLGLYSGNVTTVPNGRTLEVDLRIDPDDYVRVWARIQTDVANKLPSLWVFLCIVVGLLLVIVLCISFFMHFVQRRRREDLRRRIINGEVDLEAMGIKRVAVPKEIVEKFPLCIYTERDEKASVAPPARTQPDPSPRVDPDSNSRRAPLFRRHSITSTSEPQPFPPSFSQTTCPICLDDFETGQTQVRQLPCHHVYHPECIDTFLIQRSSLCPLCKESVLPPGYCPVKITNMMVRRERMLARMREQRAQRAAGMPQQTAPSAARRASGSFLSLGNRVRGAMSSRVFSAPERARLPSRDIEMAPTEHSLSSTQPAAVPASDLPASRISANIPAQACEQTANVDRNTLLQRRALDLLGNNHVPESDEEAGPRWKRLFRKVFPGFR